MSNNFTQKAENAQKNFVKIAYSKICKISNVLSANAQIYHLKLCACTFCEQNITKKLTYRQSSRKLIIGSVEIDHFRAVFGFQNGQK
jgi:hypothetical protein